VGFLGHYWKFVYCIALVAWLCFYVASLNTDENDPEGEPESKPAENENEDNEEPGKGVSDFALL